MEPEKNSNMRGHKNFLGGLKNRGGKAFKGPVTEGCGNDRRLLITVSCCFNNPMRTGLFNRSPGPGVTGGSEARMPKIKVTINRFKSYQVCTV